MMYCVYLRTTGVIRAAFDTSESDVEQQLQSDDEAVYIGAADPKRHIIVDGHRVDLKETDPMDGSVWDDGDNRWISPPEQRNRQVRIAKLRMRVLESKQQPRIEREIKLRPNEVGADGKTPLQRLEELDAEMAKLRAVINA